MHTQGVKCGKGRNCGAGGTYLVKLNFQKLMCMYPSFGIA